MRLSSKMSSIRSAPVTALRQGFSRAGFEDSPSGLHSSWGFASEPPPSACSEITRRTREGRRLLPLHSRAASADKFFHFFERGHRSVAGSGHGERAMGGAVIHAL